MNLRSPESSCCESEGFSLRAKRGVSQPHRQPQTHSNVLSSISMVCGTALGLSPLELLVPIFPLGSGVSSKLISYGARNRSLSLPATPALSHPSVSSKLVQILWYLFAPPYWDDKHASTASLGVSTCSWTRLSISPDPWPCWLGLTGIVVHEYQVSPQ